MSDKMNGADSSLEEPKDSIFSNFVTVISGARQTANQEFSRFWDKFTHHNKETAASQARFAANMQRRHQLFDTSSFGTESDLARIEAGKIIHGRLVPDNHRRVGYYKDAEIQTETYLEEEPKFSVIKRKSSLLSEDENETHVPPYKISKQENSKGTQVESKLSSSIKESPTRSISSPVRHSPVGTTHSIQSSPVRHSPVRPTHSIQSSPVRSSPFKSSPFRSSPIRSSPDNHIKTGSVKSVKRLTFELEEAFSPRFPIPLGQPKKHATTTTTKDDSDPFHSTPLIKNSANDYAPVEKNSMDPVKKKDLIKEDDLFHLKDSNEIIPSANFETDKISFDKNSFFKDNDPPLTSQYTSPFGAASQSIHKSPSKRLNQEEEDRRLEDLERKVSSIKSQMNNYVSYPTPIRSPVPSHTVTSEVNDCIKDSPPKTIFSPVRVLPNTNSPTRASPNTDSPTRVSALIETLTSPYRASTPNSSSIRASTSVRSTTPIRVSPIRASIPPRTPYSRPSKASTDQFTPPPPPPPAPPAPPPPVTEIPQIFSPVRDIPKAVLTKRLGLTTNHARPNSIKESQRAPFLGSTTTSPDEKLKPTDEHKSTMRELVQLIPGVKLRKTDKLIGPDGKERPNPFWNEIYNRGGRKVY